MKAKLITIVLIAACAFALPASAAGPRTKLGPTDVVVIPCGTMSQLYNTPRPRQAGENRVLVEFDASNGGTLWTVVPPNSFGRNVIADTTTRHYTATVAIHPDGPNPQPVQVMAAANSQGCVAPGMTVNNLTVTFGP